MGQSKKGKKSEGPGETGVEFRYYNKNEYMNLNRDQKKDLAEWRSGKKKGDGDSGKNQKIASQESTLQILEAKISALTTAKEDKNIWRF